MNTMHNASYAHVADPRTAARLAHGLLRPSRPLEPAARSRSHARSRIHTTPGPRRLSCALLTGDTALRGARARSAACAGAPARCALERAAPDVPRRRPSNPHLREHGRRVRDVSVVRGRRPPSSGGCTYLRGIKVVRWPRIQPPEVALQQAGRHASGGASVRRRRSVVTHHRGGRCARCLCLYQLLFVC